MTDDQRRKGKVGLVALLLFLLASPAAAQSIGDGIAAYALQDFATAEKIFRRHAEAGDAEAAFRLGWLYENGRASESPDVQRAAAARWYARAAEAGHPRAAERLAALAADGVAPAEADRVAPLVAAAEAGSVRAMLRLARAHAAGDGVPLDLDAAARWLEKAEKAAQDPALAAYARAALTALAMERSRGAESREVATTARNSK